MLPDSLLDADDDWQETLRAKLYPALHTGLQAVGLYGVGTVGNDQYVGTSKIDEETLEEELVALGFKRNPVACYKRLPDGRGSTGSWVLLPEDAKRVENGMQLHVTLFPTRVGEGVEVYAHYEDDWRKRPLSHLREKRFRPHEGASLARAILMQHSFIEI